MERSARAWAGLGGTAAALFVLTAVLATRAPGVAQVDRYVTAALAATRSPGLTRVVVFITDLGSYLPVTLLMVGLALLLTYRTRRLLEPLVLVAAVEGSESLVILLKEVFERTRPPLSGMVGAPVWDSSFPSGHTASGTVLYVLGALLLTAAQPGTGRRALLGVGCGLAVLIGLSRVYLGYHWLTDVAGGWLLAATLIGFGAAFAGAGPRPGPAPVLDPPAPPIPLARVSAYRGARTTTIG